MYTDKTQNLLNSIVRREFSVEENFERIKSSARKKIEKADTIVCCGTLPFSKKFAQKMAETRKCFYLDSGDGEGMFGGCPLISVTDLQNLNKNGNVLYVVLSRSMLEFYNFIAKKTNPFAEAIFYPSAELAFEEFFSENAREDYTPNGIKKSIKYIHDNAEKIKEILASFSDALSQEIYARMIFFRLTFDLDANLGIKSQKTEYLDDDIIKFSQKENIVYGGGILATRCLTFPNFFRSAESNLNIICLNRLNRIAMQLRWLRTDAKTFTFTTAA
jgi:hypothetical protein